MLALLRSPWTWGVLLGLVVIVVVVAVATGGEDDEEESAITDIERSPDTPIVIPAGEPIIIGVSGPLSGPTEVFGIEGREAAAVSVELWKAANEDTIGGHEIEIHAEDDGCFDADITARAAGHLLYGRDDHQLLPGLVGVIGPTCSDGASRVIPVYAQAGIVMISGSATRSDLTTGQTAPEFFFRTAYSNSQEGALQARYVIEELGAATAYVIDDNERYGTDLANSLQARLRGGGVEVNRESINVAEDVDFSDLAGRIAADGPEVVVFAGFNPEGALLYRQLRDAGYGGTFLSGDGVVSVSDFIEPLGELAEGVVFAGCSLTLPEEFLSNYVSIIGSEPETPFPAQFVDAVTVLLDAVAQVAEEQADGSLVIDPLELRAAVAAAELAGVSGAIAFDENGDRVGEGAAVGLQMCRVEGGRLVNFEF